MKYGTLFRMQIIKGFAIDCVCIYLPPEFPNFLCTLRFTRFNEILNISVFPCQTPYSFKPGFHTAAYYDNDNGNDNDNDSDWFMTKNNITMFILKA